MSKVLFIRSENRPVARLGCGSTFPPIEFTNNMLLVDEGDTTLLWHLRAEQYEEVSADDPRYGWIVTNGWSRMSQRDYARQPVPEPPVEG